MGSCSYDCCDGIMWSLKLCHYAVLLLIIFGLWLAQGMNHTKWLRWYCCWKSNVIVSEVTCWCHWCWCGSDCYLLVSGTIEECWKWLYGLCSDPGAMTSKFYDFGRCTMWEGKSWSAICWSGSERLWLACVLESLLLWTLSHLLWILSLKLLVMLNAWVIRVSIENNNLEACYASDANDGSNSINACKRKAEKLSIVFDIPKWEPKIEGYDTLQGTLSILPVRRTFPMANGIRCENVEWKSLTLFVFAWCNWDSCFC
jgi:hypothetical protein